MHSCISIQILLSYIRNSTLLPRVLKMEVAGIAAVFGFQGNGIYSSSNTVPRSSLILNAMLFLYSNQMNKE